VSRLPVIPTSKVVRKPEMVVRKLEKWGENPPTAQRSS
jgi:hypothetical protein